MLSIYTQFSVVGAENLHSDRILRSRLSLHYFPVCYVATVLFAPLGGLPSRVAQDRKSLSLCVRIFEDFYRVASAPASNAETTRSFERGSEKRSGASGELGRMEANRGTLFFSSFFFTKINVHKIYARPEALMSIPNVLTQQPSRPSRGAICPAGPI